MYWLPECAEIHLYVRIENAPAAAKKSIATVAANKILPTFMIYPKKHKR